jgi:hypothetical protein
VLLVLVLLGGGGYAAYAGLSGGSSNPSSAKLPLCPVGNTLPKVPRVPSSKLVVNNASLTAGLAASVANELKHRGFRIKSVGNTAEMGKGVATVRYSPDRKVQAEQVASEVKGAKLVAATGSGYIEIDLDPQFTALVSNNAAKKAFRLTLTKSAVGSASASPSPTVSASPTCRPRH